MIEKNKTKSEKQIIKINLSIFERNRSLILLEDDAFHKIIIIKCKVFLLKLVQLLKNLKVLLLKQIFWQILQVICAI